MHKQCILYKCCYYIKINTIIIVDYSNKYIRIYTQLNQINNNITDNYY